ncbi:MAG: hypothetical protein K1X67_07745 [Fimbriimonadaceae bacterium]|nr:hypothetical protein [Fimbriimonadaceae bacterium]
MRAWLAPLSLFLVAIACSSHEDLDLPVQVALQPLGHVGKGDLARVERALERQFKVQVSVLPLQPLPKEAFTKPRQRWRTEKLRAHLARTAPARFQRVMGLTDRDISTTHRGHYDYGIAGEATINGRPCVVSSFRLKKKADSTELAARVEQTAIHELAHTFGLGHCPDRQCAMRDGKWGLNSLPRDHSLFCKSCVKKLGRLIR